MAIDDTEKNFELPQEIFDELEKISKMGDNLEKFNTLVEKTNIENDVNIIKKDKKNDVPSVLSPKEKKRYENLGKAFMAGVDEVISDIQNAISKKEKAALSDKDSPNSIENKIKNAEKKIETNRKKKSSLVKKILVSAGILGGVYLLFSNTINGAISNMYNNIKNGMMGLGDFVKKAASSVFSFFGNLFIKASKVFSGGGLLTNVVIQIIWDFFNMTLPKMVISLTEDLVRIFDKSFQSSTELESRENILQTITDNNKRDAQTASNSITDALSKFLLSSEKDIRENGILNAKEQEKIADESVGIIQTYMSDMAKSFNKKDTEQSRIMSQWAITCTRLIANNQFASTAFYDSSTKIISSLGKLVPDLDTLTVEQLKNDEDRKNYIANFIKDYGNSIGMVEKEIEAYSNMSTENQLDFLRSLKKTMTDYTSTVSSKMTEAENKKRAGVDDSNRNSMASILNDIRKDAKDKENHLKIIQFQEVKELGIIHTKIKSFINDGRYPEAVKNMTDIISTKFHKILDASNKALSNLTKAVANEFTLTLDDKSTTVGSPSDEEDKNYTKKVSPMDDYKIMYIFNNNVSSNEGDIQDKMNSFMESSARYLDVLGKELRVLVDLERISILMHGYEMETVKSVNKMRDDVVTSFNNHIALPVGNTTEPAHAFIPLPQQMSNNGGPLSCSMGGFAAI